MKIAKKQLRQIIREEISRIRTPRRTRRRQLVREAKSSGTLSDVVSILKAYKRAADQGALGEDRFLFDFLDQSAESDGSRWLRSLDHEDFREIENDIAGPRAVSARKIRSYVSDRWGDDIKASDPGKAAAPWVNLDPSTKQAVIRFLSTYLAKERVKWDSGDEENEVSLARLVYNNTPGYDPFAGWTASEKRGAAVAQEWLKSSGEASMIGVQLEYIDGPITPKAIEKAIIAALTF